MIEIFETPKSVYLVMELVTGGELFQKICSQKSFSEADAARMMTELCEGLRYLHSLGIVHRDLKPENILLESPDPAARIKIADFGLSKILRGGRFLHSRCGTPAYAAPELVEGKPYDSKVDVWAAGCILYILLTGCPPFWGTDTNELFGRIVSGVFPMDTPQMEGVSSSAKSLVRKMLVVDPAARYSAADVLRHSWITGDLKKLEFKKLSTIVSITEYVERHKQSIARYQDSGSSSSASSDLLMSTEGESSTPIRLMESGSFTLEDEKEMTLLSAPLSLEALLRMEAKYSEWPDYRKEYEKGNVLGCSDISSIRNTLIQPSTWKTRASEIGYLRPFLILASMHPAQRLGFAKLLKVCLSPSPWFLVVSAHFLLLSCCTCPLFACSGGCRFPSLVW
jgi:serine/threonine protein kinase